MLAVGRPPPLYQRRIFFLRIAKAFWNQRHSRWFSLYKKTLSGCLCRTRSFSQEPRRSPSCVMHRIERSCAVNVFSSGSPSRMRMVRRISLGMTTLPRSSIRLTIPVAFMLSNLSLSGLAGNSSAGIIYAPHKVILEKSRRCRRLPWPPGKIHTSGLPFWKIWGKRLDLSPGKPSSCTGRRHIPPFPQSGVWYNRCCTDKSPALPLVTAALFP